MSLQTTKLIMGNKAHDHIVDANFVTQWLRLFDQCEYATVFQHPSFVQTWYETYKLQWLPILVKYEGENGTLGGLWLLAYSDEKKTLVHAGAHQSEYQVWLAKKGEEVKFVSDAWNLLKQNLDFEELHFKYLPCGNLSNVLNQIMGGKSCIVERKYKRPIQEINSHSLRGLFSKRNKQRIKRLEELGKLEFRRITDPLEFDNVFTELTELYDYRMGAINGVNPFQEDKFKRQFYLNLLKTDNNLFLVCVTYLNNRPIAAGLSGISKGTVHLYLAMHSPIFNIYSPGITHMLQFSEYLLKTNIYKMDLTPGGDPWKSRFVTFYDEVAYAIFYKYGYRKIEAEIKFFCKNATKKILYHIGLDHEKLKDHIKHKHHKIKTLATIAKEGKWKYLDFKIDLFECTFDRLDCKSYSALIDVKKNSLSNLLLFSQDGAVITKRKFLLLTYKLFEKGAISYSIKNGNELLACVWALHNQSTFKINKNQPEVILPTKGTVLFNFYINYRFTKDNFYEEIISEILNAIVKNNKEDHFYAFVDSKNLRTREALKSINFRYKKSYTRDLSHLWQN